MEQKIAISRYKPVFPIERFVIYKDEPAVFQNEPAIQRDEPAIRKDESAIFSGGPGILSGEVAIRWDGPDTFKVAFDRLTAKVGIRQSVT